MRIKDVTVEAKKSRQPPVAWAGCDAVFANNGFKPVSGPFLSKVPEFDRTYKNSDGIMVDMLAPTDGGRADWSMLCRIHPKVLSGTRIVDKAQSIGLNTEVPISDPKGDASPDTSTIAQEAVSHAHEYADTFEWAKAVSEETREEIFMQGRIVVLFNTLTLSGVQFEKSSFSRNDFGGGIASMLEMRDSVIELINGAARRCSLSLDSTHSSFVLKDSKGTSVVTITSRFNETTTGINVSIKTPSNISIASNVSLMDLKSLFEQAMKEKAFPWNARID